MCYNKHIKTLLTGGLKSARLFAGDFMDILLVEDNKAISKGLVYSLEQNGYNVTLCESAEQAMSAIPNGFDLFIFDITLPDGNGFELFEDMHRLCDAPVIFLTALDDEDSIVKGFELGADDYITKPFSTRELLARIKRTTRSLDSNSIAAFGDICIDYDKKAVYKSNNQIELTALEYKIFSMLAQNAGKIVTRDIILERIWDIAGNYVEDNTLTVYIKRIRQKLGTDIIKTVKGLGYKLEVV